MCLGTFSRRARSRMRHFHIVRVRILAEHFLFHRMNFSYETKKRMTCLHIIRKNVLFSASLYFYKSAVYLRNLPLSLFTAYTAHCFKPFYPQKSHIQSLYSKYLLLPLLLTVLQVDVHEHWL